MDRLVLAAALVAFFSLTPGVARSQSDKELATALQAKHVALATGVSAASTTGKPISAKYEYEGGALQLSVYTEKAGAFAEVIVDYTTGKIAKTEKITDGADLKAAQAQSAALAKGSTSLAGALERALAANKGYGAVSVTPGLKGGKPIVEITLSKGNEFKHLSEPLD